LEDHHPIAHLAEANEKVAVRRRGVNFVTEVGKGAARRLEPFRAGECQQGRLIRGAYEIKCRSHALLVIKIKIKRRIKRKRKIQTLERTKAERGGYLILRVAGTGGAPATASLVAFIRSELMVVVVSPRVFLILSIPRVTGPRLVQ